MLDYTLLRKDMDVYDRDDDKVGTVGDVHVPADVTTATDTGTFTSGGSPQGDRGVLKVDTGFLGLGKDLYIPFSAIRALRGDNVYLSVDKDEIDRMGWDERPTWLS